MPEPWRERWHTLCSACVCAGGGSAFDEQRVQLFQIGCRRQHHRTIVCDGRLRPTIIIARTAPTAHQQLSPTAMSTHMRMSTAMHTHEGGGRGARTPGLRSR